MNKLVNGEVIAMTEKEIAELQAREETDEVNALNEFFNTLAQSDTNSIAKIRTAAQVFVAKTAGGEDE